MSIRTEQDRALLAGRGPAARRKEAPVARGGLTNPPPRRVRICQSEPSRTGPCRLPIILLSDYFRLAELRYIEDKTFPIFKLFKTI
ncbi:hypothetical protein QUF80_20165 [Desulfococcaceae bacterium HSG8]|nr:hypothetical protein [Desulfococcaceae bacterium HSG8]